MSRQKTVILTPKENNIILNSFHSKLMNELKNKRTIIEADLQELIDYSNNLQEEINNQNNQMIKDLKLAHIINVNLIIDQVEDFDKFIKELDTDWLHEVVENNIKSQIDKKVYKALANAYNEERQFVNFTQIVYESILQNNRESFYHRMCNFFKEGIEIRNKNDQLYASKLEKIKEFAVYSEMARLLANALFKTNVTENMIKSKKEGDVVFYNIPYTLQSDFNFELFGTTSKSHRKGNKGKEDNKLFL